MSNSLPGQARLALFVALVLMAPVYSPLGEPTELRSSEPLMAQHEGELKLYTLYLASQNTSAGGDGYITTEVPDSGGQDSASALDSELEFRSSDMLSCLLYTSPSPRD